MSGKVLVVYASRVGSTEEVATEIVHVLREAGAAVDLRALSEVRQLEDYRAVVLGSAIRFGKVLPEVQRFVETHRVALKQIPVAYFVVCMTLKDDTDVNRQTVRGYIEPLIALVPPVDVALFAGVVDTRKLAPMLRMLVNAIQVPQGDFRDWDAIRSWAAALPALLRTEAQPR